MAEEIKAEEIQEEGKNDGVSGAMPSEELDELPRCEKERDEYLDGWKRAKADLANYKKDEAKRFEFFAKFSQEALIQELINVLDSFDLASISEEVRSDSKTQKGLYLIRQQLEDILRKNGLERIIISVGSQFNPAREEAIASIESDKPSGAILEEVERGYLLNGKLVRPARVKISK